ncbi:MAG: SET domain-containing protein-lysine N-methyltransferase [Candidatus Nanopelagicales bacterium]|nr:SET domain-containing protein-lysine N-methyltransferase [Candidatus Nanopelagicales bacterium]
MQHSWLTPKAVVRPVGEHGFGAFALAPILAGEEVAAFGGWVVTRAQLGDFAEDRVSRSIQIADELYLLATEQPEPGDLINHSCDPNCGLLGETVLVARADVGVGEELTFDYGTCDGSAYDEFDCACGARRCRGRVTGDDWRDRDFQMRHNGWFSPYLARRIAAQHGRSGAGPL